MFESLTLYFKTLIQPWDVSEQTRKISYIEVLGISWALRFIYTFYSVFAVFLGVKSYEYFSTSEDFTHIVMNSVSFSFQKISLFVQLAMVVLYPVLFHLTYKFWVYLLNFFAQVFDQKNDSEAKVIEIVNAMYTSNVFLILPIAGAVLSFLAQTLILYRGVTTRLNFSKTQAVLVLMTPFFILFILAILIVSYFIFLVSLL
jgi:hypothetical protein